MLKAFSISGYKAFRDASMDLAPITLIYGQNSAGKSTIIEALQLARAGVRFQLGDFGVTGAKRWAQFVEIHRALHHKGNKAPFHFGLTSDSETIFVSYASESEAWFDGGDSDLPAILLPPRTSLASIVDGDDLNRAVGDGAEKEMGVANDSWAATALERIGEIKEFLGDADHDPDAAAFPHADDWLRVPDALSIQWLPDMSPDAQSPAILGIRDTPEDVEIDALSPDEFNEFAKNIMSLYIAAYYGSVCSTETGMDRFVDDYMNSVLPEIARVHEAMTYQVQDELRLSKASNQFTWPELMGFAWTALSELPFETLTNDDGEEVPLEIRSGDYFIEVTDDDSGFSQAQIKSPVSTNWEAEFESRFAISDALRNVLTNALTLRLAIALSPALSPWASIGPFRHRPGWHEDVSFDEILSGSSVGDDGHLLPAVIFRHRNHALEFRVNQWLVKLGIPYEFANGDPEQIFEEHRYDSKRLTAYRFRPRLFDLARCDGDGDPIEVGFEDVGYGLNQVLPIITQLCSPMPANSLVTIQQPELHIHPRLQTELGDLLLESTMTNVDDPAFPPKQVIVETHSEHILLRIQRRIREGKVDPSHVSVLYVDTAEDGGSVVHRIRLGDKGEFLDEWPDGFFGERLMEILGY
jgi:hypothetical protein